LEKFILGSKDISGLNITVPHKERCLALLDSIDPLARSIGAVNTIVSRDGKLTGYNTDSHGFIAALKEDLGFEAKGKSVFVLGSGGASKAVSFAIASSGGKRVILTDLYLDKVKLLANNIKKFYPGCVIDILEAKALYGAKDLEGVDLLVNATPLGLKRDDPTLFDKAVFKKGLAVYDLVYNPVSTKLVQTARAKGVSASGGLGMLLYQGARSFELWTGKTAPIEVMKKALLNTL